MIGLLRSEVMKVRTTAVWWAMLLGLVACVVIVLGFNTLGLASQLHPESFGATREDVGPPPEAQFMAVTMFRSGGYFGMLLAALIGVLIATNEYFHQTITATFLAAPHRMRVVGAKLLTSAGWGLAFGLITAIISIPAGIGILAALGVDDFALDDPDVWRSVALNVLAFAAWGVIGLGIGTLIRNQIVAVVTVVMIKIIAETVILLVLNLLAAWLDQEWLLDAQWALPSQASTALTAVEQLEDVPAWWAGALIMLAWGVVTAGFGALLTRRRDVS